MRILLVAIALGALASCGAQNRPAIQASRQPVKIDAVAAAAPREVQDLTDQKKIWECPKCGTMYDAPGQCSMDKSTLVETKVDYICPADNRPVDKSGKCPRCAANARVVKTAIAAAAPGASIPTGN